METPLQNQDGTTEEVLVIENTINRTHIIEAIEKFHLLKKRDSSNLFLRIKAQEKIEQIDFSLITHFIYFKKTLPQLTLGIELHKNEDDSLIKKLKQFMWQTLYFFPDQQKGLFYLTHKKEKNSNELVKYFINDKSSFNWFTLSRKFLPAIYLDKQTYTEIFQKPITFTSLPVLNIKDELTEKNLYSACRQFLFQKVKNNTTSSIDHLHILAQTSFYYSLSNIKHLRYYLFEQLDEATRKNAQSEQDREKLQVSYVSQDKLKEEYRRSIEIIIAELQTKPPVYHLIFFTLTSSNLITNSIDNSNIQQEATRILSLWDFTKELVYGIQELAKNIIQHSSTGAGVISGFINNKNQFELSISDYGDTGIIQTLHQSTRKLREKLEKENSPIWKDIWEDEKRLESDNFVLDDLFAYYGQPLLNQQTKRAMAHLGLMFFSQLVEENYGCLQVSTKGKEKMLTYQSNDELPRQAEYCRGTCYDILLPLDRKREYQPYKQIPTIHQQTPDDTRSMEELLQYREIRLDENEDKEEQGNEDKKTLKENQKYIFNIILKNNTEENRAFEESLWNDFYNCILQESFSKHIIKDKSIVCISFEKIENLDASKLFRFLGKWELHFPANNLIVYNITTQLYLELVELNKSYHNASGPSIPYWNPSAVTIIYSYKTLLKDHSRKFYFTDALWGETEYDFFYINTLIQKNNYNASSVSNKIGEKKKETVIPPNNLFYKSHTLLPFDIMITTPEQISLYEYKAITLLNNELIPYKEPDNLTTEKDIKKKDNTPPNFDDILQHLPGFKIPDSHFRLGSKIHITDYYYAKRFFQNSYYSSRFALIIAKYIIAKYPDKIDNLTLIGYGLYSELLISMTADFLKTVASKGASINHNLYKDTDNLVLVKGYEEINENVLIIVPIASTFSTSIKIKNKLLEKTRQPGKKINILPIHLNVIAVSNGDINHKTIPAAGDIERKFGWVNVDPQQKTVEIKPTGETESCYQKYFIALTSTWFTIDECRKCFPGPEKNCIHENCNECKHPAECPRNEKPLLVTDKTSVTPALVFDYPKARMIYKPDLSKFELSNKALEYGHSLRNNEHFHYYIYDEKFYEENKDRVVKWLKDELYPELEKNTGLTKQDNILIIAPEHYSNTVFVNLVNDTLFANSANILHYDVWKNDFSNFQTFYLGMIHMANKIFFVDDTIVSGNTFFKANDFVKLTTGRPYGFDAGILLINRINYLTQRNIQRKLATLLTPPFYSFANLQLPAMKDNGNDCQLCNDYYKAKSLFYESFLDRFKHYFHNRVVKLQPREITLPHPDKTNPGRKKSDFFEDEHQHQRKMEAIHRIYQYFSPSDPEVKKQREKTFVEAKSLYDWQKDLINKTDSPFIPNLMKLSKETKPFPLQPETATLLKVLGVSPFSNYKIIKEKIFEWTNNLLNDLIEEIKQNNYEFEYKTFRDLKFMIRRAGLLNSNFLISHRFLRFILNFYRSDSWRKLKDGAKNELKNPDITEEEIQKNETIINNLNDFSTYTVAQIKELIFLNESKTTLIETQLVHNIKDEELIYPKLRQFFRILKEENGLLIKRFWEYFRTVLLEDIKQNEHEYISKEDAYTNRTEIILKKIASSNQYMYLSLVNFLEAAGEGDPLNSQKFRNYLNLQTYFELETNEKVKNKAQSLQQKTTVLCKKLTEIISPDSPCGCFLLVKYRRNIQENKNAQSLFLAYNSGTLSSYIDTNWDTKENHITQYVEGTHNQDGMALVTIDILEKIINEDDTVSWESLYSTPAEEIKIDFLKEHEDAKYLLLMRLSLKSIQTNGDIRKDSLGVLVFYSPNNIFSPNNTSSPNNSRYLLLLRESLSKFIKDHHQNDEFRDWKEAYDDLSTINLAGHSREMLQSIAQTHEKENIDGNGKEKRNIFRYKSIVTHMEHLQTILRLKKTIDKINNENYGQKIFGSFYNFFKQESITNEYLQSLKEMGEFVFNTHYIENPEDVHIPTPTDKVNFPFSRAILDIICFEIFVNAKKNRWIFLEGESITINNQQYTKNVVRIDAEKLLDKLILTISNTGPYYYNYNPAIDNLIEQLNHPVKENPKGTNELSGIGLIRALLKNFESLGGLPLGEISFDYEKINDECINFIVTLSLNKMKTA